MDGTNQPPDSQIVFSHKPIGRQGKIQVHVKWEGGSYTHAFNVMNSVARKRFANELESRLPGLDRSHVDAQLDHIAEEIANKSFSSDGENDRADARDDQILIEIGRCAEQVELFHTGSRYDAEPYARILIDGHYEVWSMRSRPFTNWLRQEFYVRMRRSPSAQAFNDATNTLISNALYEGISKPVYLRIAPFQDGIVVDLGDDEWNAVVITAMGWRIVPSTDLPVLFTRRKGMLALPKPIKGGSIELLRPFVNIASDSQWVLYVSTLVSMFRPRGPYVVLVFSGEQGSAKSTTLKKTRALIDPNSTPARRLTRDTHDLMIAAVNSYVLGFDNLSLIQPAISDALCSLTTGGGFSTRLLYTDDEERLFDAMRPVILNGIEDVVTRPDLLDRSVVLALPTINERRRREEGDLDAAFEKARPRILGALLDVVATALARYDSVVIKDKPRMADFAHWCTAAERGFGWTDGTFLKAYRTNRDDAVMIALESAIIGTPLLKFMRNEERWSGTASALLEQLEQGFADTKVKAHKDWPKTGRAMSECVKRIAPALRAVGLDVTQGERSKDENRDRLITLRRVSTTPPDDGVDGLDDLDGVAPTSDQANVPRDDPRDADRDEASHQNRGTQPSRPSAPSTNESSSRSVHTAGGCDLDAGTRSSRPSDDTLAADPAAHETAMAAEEPEDAKAWRREMDTREVDL